MLQIKTSLLRLAIVWLICVYTILVTQIGCFDTGCVVNIELYKNIFGIIFVNTRKCEDV